MQLEVVVEPTCARVQGLPEKLPVPLVAKLTVPPGADGVPASVSETVAVQVVDWSTATVAGVQPVTVVVVARVVTLSPLPVESELPACVESLAVYAAVIVCVPVPAAVGV